MGKVVNLKDGSGPAEALRDIADGMDAGEIDSTNCTVIAGIDVFHVGAIRNDQTSQEAIFNMTMGIQILMAPVVGLARDRQPPDGQ